jgi:hypothetical protein
MKNKCERKRGAPANWETENILSAKFVYQLLSFVFTMIIIVRNPSYVSPHRRRRLQEPTKEMYIAIIIKNKINFPPSLSTAWPLTIL